MKIDLADSMAQRDAFFAAIINGERDLFSFVANGERIFSSRLSPTEVSNPPGKRVFVWELAQTQVFLELHFKLDKPLPYLEYESFFFNSGRENSGTVADFHFLEFTAAVSEYYESAVDSSITSRQVNMVYYLGSSCKSDDFQRREKLLTEREFENSLSLGSSVSGRPSQNHMPFFRADLDDSEGFDFGMGWSGAWMADACMTEHKVSIRARMVQCSFYLKPGERLRAPGAFIGFRKGVTAETFINIHRQYMMKNHAPRNSRGELLLPPVSAVDWGGVKSSDMMTMLDLVRKHQIPIETHWIDAGWMGEDAPCPHPFDPDRGDIISNWPERVGTLRTNRYSHPNGLKETADHAAAGGIDTLLWFENERVHVKCGDASLEEHPEWFFPAVHSSNFLLLDLGNDEARSWLTRSVTAFMKENHITHYRQDFNINPFPIWCKADEPGRSGVTEMKCIDGLYRFWGDLRKEFPDMFIDNCASGGRRLDYMLADFSFPLCQSDYGCHQECSYTALQLQNLYLNEIYPLHSTLSWMPAGDLYAAFSSGCGMGVGSKAWNFPSIYPKEDYPIETYREALKAIIEMRSCMTGDYYQLTPHPEKKESFCAIQCFNETLNRGFILVFRRSLCRDEEFFSQLRDINTCSTYEIREFMKEEKKCVTGKEFRSFSCRLPEPRSVRLFFYSSTEEKTSCF